MTVDPVTASIEAQQRPEDFQDAAPVPESSSKASVEDAESDSEASGASSRRKTRVTSPESARDALSAVEQAVRLAWPTQ